MKQNPIHPTSDTSMRPFRVNIAEDRLSSIQQRVKAYRCNALSEPLGADVWRYGPPMVFLIRLSHSDLPRYFSRHQ